MVGTVAVTEGMDAVVAATEAAVMVVTMETATVVTVVEDTAVVVMVTAAAVDTDTVTMVTRRRTPMEDTGITAVTMVTEDTEGEAVGSLRRAEMLTPAAAPTNRPTLTRNKILASTSPPEITL